MFSRRACATCSQVLVKSSFQRPISSSVLASCLRKRNHPTTQGWYGAGLRSFVRFSAPSTYQVRTISNDRRIFPVVDSGSASSLGHPQRSFSSRRRNDKPKNSENVLANENLVRELTKKFPNAPGPDKIEVRLVIDEGIDEPATVQVCSLAEAIEVSLDRMADLIGVALQSNPPVIRVAQLSKLEYQKEQASAKQKSASKSKQKKTYRFRAGIDMHDLNRKIQDMTQCLEKGMECEYTVFSRARMMREDAQAGTALVERIQELLSHCAVQKNAPLKSETGNHIRVVLIPKKN
jgi:translation initiation factor IF-3